MVGKAKEWFGGLVLGKKIVVSLVAFFIGMSALGAVLPEQQNATSKNTNAPAQAQTININNEAELNKVETKEVSETEVIPFESTTQEDPNRTKGETFLAVAGVAGERTIKYSVKTQSGKEIEKTKIGEEVTKAPVSQVTKVGTYVKPVVQVPAPRAQSSCDPNYTPCVPNVSYDLDCPDIGFRVRVIGSDPHRFDADRDGYGCDSY